jgi:hypothetical protein
LLAACGGDAKLLAEMIQLFHWETPELMAQIESVDAE